MRKILAITFILCVTALSCHAYDIEYWDVYFNLYDNGEATVTSGENAYSGFVSIPDSIDCEGKTYCVTAIADHAFTACSALTSVRLPNHLRTIGTAAFSQCRSLSYLSLPSELQTIGDAAFYGCTKLGALKIPASVTAIGPQAFAHCSQLTAINVNEQNAAFMSLDGVLYNKVGTELLAYPNAHNKSFSVPDGVERIAAWAFDGCTMLQELKSTASVTAIGDAAFYGCSSLQKVTLNEGLTDIGAWAFAECRSLKEMTLPASMNKVADGSFAFCDSLKNIFVDTANDSFCSVDGVLMNKAQTAIVAMPGGKGGVYSVPEGVTSLDNHAFYGNNVLTEVIIPASVTSIGENPFAFCDGLKEIVVDNANAHYSDVDGVLTDKQQTNAIFCPNGREGDIVLPEGINDIGDGSFLLNQKLKNISLPNTLTQINDNAFMGCYGLQGITIPYSIDAIGENAFADCAALQDIIACGSPVATTNFNVQANENATLFVTEGATADYKNMKGWNAFEQVKEYGIFLPYDNAKRGGHHEAALCAAQTIPLTDICTDIVLPEGMKIVGATLTEEGSKTHSISCKASGDNTFTLNISPLANGTLASNEVICHLTLEIMPDVPTGPIVINLTNTRLGFDTQHLRGTAQQKDMPCPYYIDVNTGIDELTVSGELGDMPADVYNLQGIRVRENASQLKGLPAGVYVVNGHKVIVR